MRLDIRNTRSAFLILPVIDSGETGFEWDRMTIKGSFTDNTAVSAYAYAWDGTGEATEFDMNETDEQIRSTGGSHSTWRIFKPSTLHSFQQDELPASTEKMGDINGNGMIDGSDATLILAAYADLSSGSTPDIDTVLADINSDGMISGVDATKVLGIYADLSSQEEN